MNSVNAASGMAVVLLGALACDASAPEPSTIDTNALFAGTEMIEVGRPTPGCVVEPQPIFEWFATGKRLVAGAVFRSNISVSQGTISNPGAAVWIWHSGLTSGREGFVRWSQGVTVQDSVLEPVEPVDSLEIGRSYVWAVWAWDDQGLEVTHSSPEIFFNVDTIPFVDSACP